MLIKDNHISALDGDVAMAIKRAREVAPPKTRVEIECDNIDQVWAALAAGPDVIMLDNMTLAEMKHAVKLIRRPRCGGADQGQPYIRTRW